MPASILDTLAGVPTHPFAVHAPIVLVPLATVAAVVLAARADLRARLTWWPQAVVAVLVAMLWFAKESGEALEASGNVLGDVERHTELAETTFALSIAWLVASLVAGARDAQLRRGLATSGDGASAATSRRDLAATGLAALAAVVAVVTTIWLVRTGHAGARSRWVG